MAGRAWAPAIVASVLLVACARHSTALSVAPPPGPPAPSSLAQRDPGASMLAAVHDARQAIALRDPIAASNDISQALKLAPRPVNEGARSLAALLGSFPVQAQLISAQALLTEGQVAGADELLKAIQSRVPGRLMPRDLSLLEAAASLELAREAASLGIPQLRTQLLCAVAALRDYRGTAYVDETMALASELERALAHPKQLRTLLPDQVGLWLARVTQLAGTARWD